MYIVCRICKGIVVLFAFNSLENLEFAATDCTASIEGRTVFWHWFPHEGDVSDHVFPGSNCPTSDPINVPPDVFKNIQLLPVCMTCFQKRVSALLLNPFISFNWTECKLIDHIPLNVSWYAWYASYHELLLVNVWLMLQKSHDITHKFS